jgi:uncharacterized protein
MSWAEVAVLVLAGTGAGLINSVVGAGTLISFPALLLLGYPPVIANVSSTVGLLPGGLAGAYGYRHTLVGRGQLVRRLLVGTIIGAVIGAVLLVALPSRAFEAVIPVLLLLAAVLAALQPRIATAVALRRAAAGLDEHTSSEVPPLLFVAILLTGVYGAYFGAAQGVVLLVLLGLVMGGALNDLNGVKNVLVTGANVVGAAIFIAVADVDWGVAACIAVGATIGGSIGGTFGRRLPAGALRILLVVVALAAAASRLL